VTPDQLRDEARFLERLALGYAARTWNHVHEPRYYAGKMDAFRQSARFLRDAAAREEGFDVKSYDGGPRAVQVAS
jgi:hypothetical protein